MPVYFEGKRNKVRYGRDLVEVRFGKKAKKEAFAVFSADDNSLSFYKRFGVPKVGERFEGKTVTEVYTGIETDVYERDKNVPWYINAQLITNVDVVDIIKPISTAYWFSRCYNLVQLDILNIDTSNVTSMLGMFGLCKSLTKINLANFDTHNVTSMRMMFSDCYKLASINVSNFNTENVTDMSRMFGKCSSLANLSISNFNTSNVSDMSRMFEACSSIVELNLSHFNIKSVMNTYGMFRECKSLVNIDTSGWNTSSVTNMSEMFADCSALIRLNISNIDTAHVTNMSAMFSGCSNLRFLNISSFDTQRVEDMVYMFDMCNNLQKIQLGDKFAWRGVHGELPIPSSSDIPGADGKWYAESDGRGYDPLDIPSNKADTYYASKDLLPQKEAFAVFSADDNSLNFYKRFNKPKIGSQFNNKSVTNVYTWNNEGQVSSEVSTFAPEPTISAPFNCSDNVRFIGIVDKILAPKSIEYWFCGFTHVTNINLSNFDTSNTTNMQHLFQNSGVIELDLSMLNTTNVQYLDGMFYNCKFLKNLDISNFDTTNVGLLSLLFLGCPSLQRIKVGNKFTLGKYLPAQNSINVPNADGKWYAASDGKGYAPADIPSNKADTYVASKTLLPPELQPKEAFAVYSDDDKSLNFYKRTLIPKAGEQFDGRTATEVYPFDENKVETPWRDGGWQNLNRIQSVSFKDVVRPASTANWFSEFRSVQTIDVKNLDTSNVSDMSNMFSNTEQLKSLDLSNFNTSKVTNMAHMFNQSRTSGEQLFDINVSSFDTSNVTDMESMFSCVSCQELDLSSFNTSKVKIFDYMFGVCLNLVTIYVSKSFIVNGKHYMFARDKKLVGGKGTVHDVLPDYETGSDTDFIDSQYARIDNPPSAPGYFTEKNTPPIIITANPNTITMLSSLDGEGNDVQQFCKICTDEEVDSILLDGDWLQYRNDVYNNPYKDLQFIDKSKQCVIIDVTNIAASSSLGKQYYYPIQHKINLTHNFDKIWEQNYNFYLIQYENSSGPNFEQVHVQSVNYAEKYVIFDLEHHVEFS